MCFKVIKLKITDLQVESKTTETDDGDGKGTIELESWERIKVFKLHRESC